MGIDGGTSAPTILKLHAATFTPKPGRTAEMVREIPHGSEVYLLDGSPSDDLSMTKPAPVATIATLAPDEVRRQRHAQTALTKIVKAKSDLRFVAKSSQAADIIAAIDALTAALDRGLGWFADDEGVIKLTVKVDGVSCNDEKFFALAETIGRPAIPALTTLLAKCRADADFPQVWSGDPEDGQQVFGTAAKALAGIDAQSWPELAEYEKCIDDSHELFFRNTVVPHFLKSHGWCDESFDFALADLVQVRGNLGDDHTYLWRRSGLAAAAQAKYSPSAFAARMLANRDRMLSSVTGSFADLVARAANGPAPTYGWRNYDQLFNQIKVSLTPWETDLFEELKRQSQP